MRSAGRAEGGALHPSVFVVDGQAGYPLPAVPHPRRGGPAQWPLYVLVALALFGVAVEACIIYNLHASSKPPETPLNDAGQVEKVSQDRDATERLPKISDPMIKPSKPTAHLTAGPNPPRADGILLWNTEGDAILHELEYREGGLEVQREGYYFVYSKVFFVEPKCQMFTHTILRRTPRYLGPDLQLMESRRFHCQNSRSQLSSYLGGVFHLVKGDTILVKVENHTLIARHGSYDNFFGAYVI